jgi:AcrR family transcriptional regulator
LARARVRPSGRRRAAARRPRGTAGETRERLVRSAAGVFNRSGYHGTDSNRLARAAGYSPATFYKHFDDKRAIFLAAYEAWVTAEWSKVERLLREGGRPEAQATRIVDLVVAHHRRWRGLRASLRTLVAADATARAFYRAQRRRQLRMIDDLKVSPKAKARRPEEDAMLLFTLERVCDAIAEGELRGLGLSVTPTIALLRALVLKHIA